MKILLAVPEYPPNHIGGGGEVFKNLAENFKKKGNDVVVIYGYYPTSRYNEKIKEYVENGIKFYQIPEIPYPKSMPFLRTVMPPNLNSWFRLNNIIKKENPDIANLHGYGFLLIDKIAKILKKNNIKYIYTLHGAPVSPGKMKGVIGLGYKFYKNIYGNKTLKNAKNITGVSKYSTSFEEFKKFKKDIIVINNGIKQDLYKESNKKSIYSRYLLKKDDSLIFLSLGRIEWLKGFQYFIEIMPELKKNGFKIKYFIAGRDNGYKNELDKLIKKYDLGKDVIYLGQIGLDEKINALSNCDFVIIPSLIENFPAVPLEAMTMDKIPIVNNAGGMPEIIKNKKNGIIVNVEKKDIFSKEVISLLRNKKLQESIKENLKEVKKYDWNEISNKYIKLMNQNEK